ncbi:MAG: hypothetical protein ACTSRA_00015 [Promethearchaeota archaeon]|nr:MAG: hypothetical protein [Helarchaeota virus Nidhogg Meg22_1012]
MITTEEVYVEQNNEITYLAKRKIKVLDDGKSAVMVKDGRFLVKKDGKWINVVK